MCLGKTKLGEINSVEKAEDELLWVMVESYIQSGWMWQIDSIICTQNDDVLLSWLYKILP